mgnify:CR=1 FL=1
MQVKNIRHVGVVTDSIEKSLGFYCDILGFVKSKQVKESGEALSTMLGLNQCIVNTCKISTPNGDAKLELLEFESPIAQASNEVSVNSLNLTHFAITVESVNEVFLKVQDLKLSYISAPVKTDGGAKVFFLRDVNNVLIEVVEE